jgi:hypothetical protein
LQNDQYGSPHSSTLSPDPAEAIKKVEPLRQLDGIYSRSIVVRCVYIRSSAQSIGKTAGLKKRRRICINGRIGVRGTGCHCQRKREGPDFPVISHNMSSNGTAKDATLAFEDKCFNHRDIDGNVTVLIRSEYDPFHKPTKKAPEISGARES